MQNIFFDNFIKFDWFIFFAAVINGVVFFCTHKKAKKLYNHFISPSNLNHVPKEVKKRLKSNTTKGKKLSTNELIETRTEMNRSYAFYSNITSAFPLLGMLGTVISLLNMSNTIGTEATTNFYAALTSTMYGVIFAMIFKLLDSTISYKIETNEICMNHLLNPNTSVKDGE